MASAADVKPPPSTSSTGASGLRSTCCGPSPFVAGRPVSPPVLPPPPQSVPESPNGTTSRDNNQKMDDQDGGGEIVGGDDRGSSGDEEEDGIGDEVLIVRFSTAT